MPDLSGRTALVTGSAAGVGRGLLLADVGADAVVHYRTSDEAARGTAAEARDRGAAATTVRGDVTDPGRSTRCSTRRRPASGPSMCS